MNHHPHNKNMADMPIPAPQNGGIGTILAISLLTMLSALLLAGCSDDSNAAAANTNAAEEQYEWNMVTTWQKNYPILGTGAELLAERITKMSRGQLTVTVYGGGEIVPPLQVFDAVSTGIAQMGHGAAYYWRGRVPAAQFFTAVPFGLTATEQAGWLYYGGGLELWREIYGKHNLVPFPAGNTGTQWGGWYNKAIRSKEDLKGLVIRMPGLGGEVMQALGAQQVLLPGSELYTSLDSGAIDAAEWVGPANDVSYGFHQISDYYYYPGWHEPGPTLEAIVNKDAWDALPEHLQTIVQVAAQSVDMDMLAAYSARNPQALQDLEGEDGLTIAPFPDDMLAALKVESDKAIARIIAEDADSAKVYKSWKAFYDKSKNYRAKAELYIEQQR